MRRRERRNRKNKGKEQRRGGGNNKRKRENSKIHLHPKQYWFCHQNAQRYCYLPVPTTLLNSFWLLSS
jgi:hypothetical protein